MDFKNELKQCLEHCDPTIAKHFETISIKPNQSIMEQNEKHPHTYIITEGFVRIFQEDLRGEPLLYSILDSWDFIGEMEAIAETKALCNVTAAGNCQLIRLKKELFLEWLTKDPRFNFCVMNRLCTKHSDTMNMSYNNIKYPIERRLLLILQREAPTKSFPSKDILVDLLGTNIRSLNRAIRSLCAKGIAISNKGKLEILDEDKFQKSLKF
ncbi:MAG: Crp/Fnr family transcriptional regulator [Eubacteriaceae bacterium]